MRRRDGDQHLTETMHSLQPIRKSSLDPHLVALDTRSPAFSCDVKRGALKKQTGSGVPEPRGVEGVGGCGRGYHQ